MRNLLFSLLAGCLAFFIIYLFGCFYNVTFDLSKFDDGSKTGITIVGGLAFLISFYIYFVISKER